MNILVINAGSSSIKYRVYTNQQVFLTGLIDGIGESQGSWHHHYGSKHSSIHHFMSHQQAFDELAKTLQQDLINCPIAGVGHRVVHGGNLLFEPTVINDQVLQEIDALSNLAPIHNPVNVEGIKFARHYFPDALQVAVFDTGFHHQMPPYVKNYAINQQVAQKYLIQHYGFHGINHEYVALKAAAFLNKPLNDCHFISLHLGNGASACLIKNGLSQDTSMGMTPLAGLVMGTRCGDIDPAIPLYLIQMGLPAAEVDKILNKQSGLMGIAQDNDMRRLLQRAKEGDAAALLAIQTYVYMIQKTIGAYLSQLQHLDALIFTGGVGENSAAIREQILAPLAHFGFSLNSIANQHNSNDDCRVISSGEKMVLVIRGDEESLIADKVANLYKQSSV